MLVALGAIPIQIDSIGRLHTGCRRRLCDERRTRRVDRARKGNFSTTGVRYILLAAVTAHARGGLPSALEAAPVPAARSPADRWLRNRSAVVAVDVPAVMVRAEEEHSAARRYHALNESKRTHAATATAGNLIAQAGACDSIRTSHAVATMGSEGQDSGPYSFAVHAIVDSASADGQLPGALRFPRSHALADIEGHALINGPPPGRTTRAIATAGDGSRPASFSRRAAQYRSAEGVNPLPCENIGAV